MTKPLVRPHPPWQRPTSTMLVVDEATNVMGRELDNVDELLEDILKPQTTRGLAINLPDVAPVGHPTAEVDQVKSTEVVVEAAAAPVVIDASVGTSTVEVLTSPARAWLPRLVHGVRYGIVAVLGAVLAMAVYQVVAAIFNFVAAHEIELGIAVMIVAVLTWRGYHLSRRASRGRDIYAARADVSLHSINRQWIMEMRHGGWRQTRASYGNGRSSHCALGVLYRVANGGHYQSGDFQRSHLIDLGYNPEFLDKVESMNQSGTSFHAIARFVERETSRGRGWAY